MVVFSQVNYRADDHAIKRYRQRVNPQARVEYAAHAIEYQCRTGRVLIDLGKHRYIKNGDLVFPCIKISPTEYVVKTILTWGMVESRMQKIVALYG